MSELQSAVDDLNNLLTPVTNYTRGPKVWLCVDGDSKSDLKGELIRKSQSVLAAGIAALSGNVPQKLPSFGRKELEAVKQGLAGDPDEHSYDKLTEASEHILLALSRGAAI